jgi:hypothetical protein
MDHELFPLINGRSRNSHIYRGDVSCKRENYSTLENLEKWRSPCYSSDKILINNQDYFYKGK